MYLAALELHKALKTKKTMLSDILMTVADGAFKKLKTETGDSGAMSGHTPAHPSSSCPTPARRRHRTTFTQVGLVDVET